ncbi:hypothetical protein AO361_17765 [Pseudomonas fluorescens]|jgi:hypothetical protein|nr:hypothetical protein AO361_17765 [Pseudomonas fluorescens]
MKGKRKVKTTKWQVAEHFKAAAQAALRARSACANRFLDAALSAGRDLEPVGLLAGIHRPVTAGKAVSPADGFTRPPSHTGLPPKRPPD